MALDDSTVKFEIWDTAGQERYRSLAPMYYRGAAAAIVVYDITNPDSFTGAKSWVKELQRRGDPNVVIALAGNKADLESRRKIEFEEANSYAEENGILHLETSAKNANNVKALFVEIAKKLPKNPPQPEREAFPLVPTSLHGASSAPDSLVTPVPVAASPVVPSTAVLADTDT